MYRTLAACRTAAFVALTLATACAPPAERTAAPGDDPPRADEPDNGAGQTALDTARAGAAPRCDRTYPIGVHPYPRGNEWPADLTGPFALREVQHVRVRSHDGVELAGTILLPDLPARVRAPVVLWSSPYLHTLDPPIDDPNAQATAGRLLPVPVARLLAEGYAVAGFNVRGTGPSGGCFTLLGWREQRDQRVLVEWLARQPWSNGRVGMMGLSYDAATALEAAVQNPLPLKTVVVSGIISDVYQALFTPQGAVFDDEAVALAPFYLTVSSLPPRSSPEALLANAAARPERLCPDVAAWATGSTGSTVLDVRDAAFFAERRLIDRFPDVRSATLIAHGLQDHLTFGEDLAFRSLTQAPRWQLAGQWRHDMPTTPDWDARLVTWLDFWLKGQGCLPEGVGAVDYQDNTHTWRTASNWPPPDAREEVLYLREGALAATSGGASAAFRATPSQNAADQSISPRYPAVRGPTPFCPATAGGETTALRFDTAPATAPVVLAGNPMAYLRLTSDQVGGLVSVQLFAVGPDFRCDDPSPRDFRYLTQGAANLRFHQGNMTGTDFATGTPTGVRIDFENLSEVIPTGHRLVAMVTAGQQHARRLRPYAPRVVVGADGGAAASHLVLPVVQGSFGGAAPTLAYPPRPFAPTP